MEKVLYPLWKDASLSGDAFRDHLLAELTPALAAMDAVRALRLAVVDGAVEAGDKRRMESHPPLPDAMLSLWVDNAGAAQVWEPVIDANVARKIAYLVAEAEPLVNQQAHPTEPGERMYGMCQVVFFSFPKKQERDSYLSVWKDSHTQVAIDTQSTFGYRQNVVVRRLGEDTPYCDVIVEENFPPEAMADDHAFYATGGDEAILKKHMTEMGESCTRFIDFGTIDVIPMSEYLVKPL